MRKEFLFLALATVALVACKPGEGGGEEPQVEKPEWYYTGGTLGTTEVTSSKAFRQPTPATENAGMGQAFAQGDMIAETEFVTDTTGRQHGLGPLYVRASCQHCHPNYSHGTSVPEGVYDAKHVGNGTLLVVINPATQGYVRSGILARPLPRRGIGRTLVSGDSPPDLCPEGALGGIAPAPAPAPPNF